MTLAVTEIDISDRGQRRTREINRSESCRLVSKDTNVADDPEFAVQRIQHLIMHDVDLTKSYDAAEVDRHVYTCISLCRSAIDNHPIS